MSRSPVKFNRVQQPARSTGAGGSAAGTLPPTSSLMACDGAPEGWLTSNGVTRPNGGFIRILRDRHGNIAEVVAPNGGRFDGVTGLTACEERSCASESKLPEN